MLGRGTSASAVLLRAPPGLVSDGDPLVVAKCFQVHSLISDNELKKIHKEVKLLQKLRNKHVIRCACTPVAYLVRVNPNPNPTCTPAPSTPNATGALCVLPGEAVASSHRAAAHCADLGVFVSGSVASVLMEYAAGGTLAGMIKAAAQERAPFVSARVRRDAEQPAVLGGAGGGMEAHERQGQEEGGEERAQCGGGGD